MRSLRFTNISDAALELDRIEKAASLRTTGLWSEAQIFSHLAGAFEYSITAYPFVAPAFIRKTIGRLMFSRMRKKGIMPSGRPNPTAPKAREEGDAKAALKHLRAAMKTFESHNGDTAVHPIFDHLTKEEYSHLHAMHMANHLSFLDPAPVAVPSGRRAAATGKEKAVPARGQKKSVKKSRSSKKAPGKKRT